MEKSRLQTVLNELKRDKKRTLKIRWVNRKNQTKEGVVRVAGIAYDGRGGLVVVLRDAHNTKMLFNLPLGRIMDISPVSAAKVK